MLEIEKLENNPPKTNPFDLDGSRMGTYIGKNVVIMYEKFDSQFQQYIIVINIETGEKVKIKFLPDDEPKCAEHGFIFRCDKH